MTRVAVLAPPGFRALELLGDFEFSDVSKAEVLLVAPRSVKWIAGILDVAHNLRWIHSLGAGVEALPFDLLRGRDIIVTNSRGIYADALAEFAIGAMLWFAKDFGRLIRNQHARRWEPFDVEWLQGKTAGVIGYGGIGSAVGRRAQAMGMNVLPVRRSEGDVDDVIGRSDYVVLSAPLTPSTRNLMNRDRIARMQRHAILINISRGAIVDERALIDALREKRIHGAALDVFENEPLPPDHPLWSLENVLVSPHSADHTPDSHERAMRFFIENLRRHERGQKLENVVDLRHGY